MSSSGPESTSSDNGPIALARDATRYKAISMAEGVGFTGVHLKKPMFVPIERFGDQRFVLLSKGCDWLCHAAAGKARGLNPLSRTSLLQHLAAEVCRLAKEDQEHGASVAGASGGMEGFGLDAEVAPLEPQPNKKAKKGQKKSAATHVVMVELPARWRGEGSPNISCLAGKVAVSRGVMVDLADLPKVVEILAKEVDAGGVQFTPSDSPLEKPFFANRDRCWVARARDPDGVVLRKSLAVPLVVDSEGGKKRALRTVEYEDAKQQKLEEIEQWQQGVRQGLMSRNGRGRPWVRALDQ